MISLVKNLNFTAEKLNLGGKISFYLGSADEKVCEIASKLTPYAKVLVLSSEKNFFSRGVETILKLKKLRLRPSSYIINDKNLSVETLSGLFNFCEDVRLVISLDDTAHQSASYFATIKNIAAIYSLSGELDFAFSTRLLIRNGDNLESFSCDNVRHIVLSSDNLPKHCEVFASTVAKAVSLTDYYFRKTLLGQAPSKYFESAKRAVKECLNCKDFVGLLEKAITLRLADFREGGEFFFGSAPTIATRLLDKSGKNTSSAELLCALYLNAFYSGEFSEDLSLFDYLSGVKNFCALSGVNLSVATKGVLKKLQTLKNRDYKSALERAKLETNDCNLSEKEYRTYLELGGTYAFNGDEVISAVKVAPFAPFILNALDAVFKSGIVL